MTGMNDIAHYRESDEAIQTVEEHLLGVKNLAETFGQKIGVAHIAGLAGLLHDMGKYSKLFQEYLNEAINNPHAPPRRGSVDHSTAGGKYIYNCLHLEARQPMQWILAEIVGNAVISHHAYLHDFLSPRLESDFLRRVRDKTEQLEEFEDIIKRFHEKVMPEDQFRAYMNEALKELEAYLKHALSCGIKLETGIMFLAKFVFSALIDADRTNTRLFEENKSVEPQLDYALLLKDYYEKLLVQMEAFNRREDADSPINRKRMEMSEQCERFAEYPPGIYTLSIPTGGGKTLTSLRYALKHAMCHGKKRIVYVVPYTTIIEQNATEIRNILKDDRHILEHHSNVVDDLTDNDEMEDGRITARQKLKLAKDNWDSPVILTTMVQFLDTFYAKGSRNIRRLHNLCEAVLIFDEVQKVPVSCISLFNHALNFLRYCGNSTIVLCTATQPALDFVEHKLAINKDGEMIPLSDDILQTFKRVEFVDRATDQSFTTDSLAELVRERLNLGESVLVILNTKSAVRKLYNKLKKDSMPVYHLSTLMCPAHRRAVINRLKEQLKRGEKIVCVSTQLIEAGVDISFDCVIRSLAGLDSIAQAAGRCNRHGKDRVRQVILVDHAEENLARLKEIRIGKQIAKKILIDMLKDPEAYRGGLLSKTAMDYYFQEFYSAVENDLNYIIKEENVHMVDLLMAGFKNNPLVQSYYAKNGSPPELAIANSYGTAAEHFKVIDQQTTSVLVPYGDEGKRIIADLNGGNTIDQLSRLLREAQLYSVNLYENERRQLQREGALVSLQDGKIVALKEWAYHAESGINLDHAGEQEFLDY
jgi:CRISPR-associated endonuclease/helicase Cas3